MPDFTSSLYLGLRHASSTLRPWTRFSTGKPAALAPPPASRRLARALAALQGCEDALLGPSTLHLFVDLFAIVARPGVGIVMDTGLYPIARWAVAQAALRGIPILRFPHHDPRALEAHVRTLARSGLAPIAVTDGVCPDCGQAAPLNDYLAILRRHAGRLVIDDSQAFGILGRAAGPDAPYGRGGGGTLAWLGAAGPEITVVSSLAKGFGVPIAVLCGSSESIARQERKGGTRVHCSPPSIAALRAVEHALAVNRRAGDRLRHRLARRVRYFRGRLAAIGLTAAGGLFPVQTLTDLSGDTASALHARLARRKVDTVLRRDSRTQKPRLTFVLNAGHRRRDIERAIDALGAQAGRRHPAGRGSHRRPAGSIFGVCIASPPRQFPEPGLGPGTTTEEPLSIAHQGGNDGYVF